MSIEIREERPAEFEAVERIVAAAFEDSVEESRLVGLMRERKQGLISLVARDGPELVGHVMVSPIILAPSTPLFLGGVAPLSVVPHRQIQGIGSKLMSAMIQEAKAIGLDALFLVGSPKYYPRFGFASSHIDNEYGATDAFMHLELSPGCLAKIQGKALYVSAFKEVGA
jgi:predicted N-acetyltransferase YhbS